MLTVFYNFFIVFSQCSVFNLTSSNEMQCYEWEGRRNKGAQNKYKNDVEEAARKTYPWRQIILWCWCWCWCPLMTSLRLEAYSEIIYHMMNTVGSSQLIFLNWDSTKSKKVTRVLSKKNQMKIFSLNFFASAIVTVDYSILKTIKEVSKACAGYIFRGFLTHYNYTLVDRGHFLLSNAIRFKQQL